MKLTFSIEQFLEVFKKYNEAVFPAQAILYLKSGIAIYLSLIPKPKANKVVVHWSHTLYMCWAITIIFVALLPPIRNSYKR